MNVFIVEDHALMRQMLCEFIEAEEGLIVTGMARTAEEALEALAEKSTDLIMVDVSLPGMDGIQFVREMNGRRPELRCLIVSGHGEARYIDQALDAGARGFVMKGDPDEMILGIRGVLRGEKYLSPSLARNLASRS